MVYTVVVQPDQATPFHEWGFVLKIAGGRLETVKGLGGLTQPEDAVDMLHPDESTVRWPSFLWMHYSMLLLRVEGTAETELCFQFGSSELRLPLAEAAEKVQRIASGPSGRIYLAPFAPLTEGRATVTPREVEAGGRSRVTWEFVVGERGIAPGGGVRFMTPYSSWSVPQRDDHTVEVESRGTAQVDVALHPYSHPVFGYVFTLWVNSGSLECGDVIRVHYAAGAEGVRVQAYPKEKVFFQTYVDAAGGGIYYPLELARTPAVKVKSGLPRRIRLVSPMLVRPGAIFTARGMVLDDNYNAPQAPYSGDITLTVQRAEDDTLPALIRVASCKDGRFEFEDLTLEKEGYYLLSATSGDLLPQRLALKCAAGAASEVGLYWGAIHGHSEMSDGEFSAEEYFRYGRNIGLVDFCSLTDHDWELLEHARNRRLGGFRYLQELAEKYDEPGRYVTLSAYEWMGDSNTGHANIYFNNHRTDNRMYVGAISIQGSQEADTLEKLLAHYQGRRDVLVVPHTSHGTTWPAWDPELMRVVEIYSCWGCSEHKLHGAGGAQSGLQKGYVLGFVGGADSHHGSPGHTGKPSKYHILPDREGFAAVYAERLDRDAIFRALYERRCYATTGERMLLEFSVNGEAMGGELCLAPGAPLHVAAVAGGTTALRTVELLCDGEVVNSRPGTGLIERYEDTLAAEPGLHYYYLRVTQVDGSMAWSSPVWVQADKQ